MYVFVGLHALETFESVVEDRGGGGEGEGVVGGDGGWVPALVFWFWGEVGGWVGGSVVYRMIEEDEAVRMRCWSLWVGGWVGGGGGGGVNELLWAFYGWVGGWVDG